MKLHSRLSLIILTFCLVVLGAAQLFSPVKASAASQPPANQPRANPHFFPSKGSQIQPQAIPAPILTYHGGPVMAGTTNIYAIFWQPGNNVASGYDNLIKQYFGDIGSSPLYRIANQYTDASGNYASNAHLAGTWVDTSSYPESPLLDSDIQEEVILAEAINNWTPGIDTIFFVFTGRGENLCFDSSHTSCTDSPTNAFCAYHGHFASDVIYAAMPYAASFSCDPGISPNNNDADQTINVASHEEMEAATNPLGTAWYDSGGSEIGDICAWQFGPIDSAGGDAVWNGHEYIVQEEWANHGDGCLVQGPNVCPANVSLGSSGTWVQVLQYSLNSLRAKGLFSASPESYTSPLTTDGVFGSQTEAATVDFQFAAGLGSSGGGVAGSRTWSLLGFCTSYPSEFIPSLGPTTRTNCPPSESQGNSDIWVQALQDSLNYYYFWFYFADSPFEFQPFLVSDGSFGTLTWNATADFQHAAGLGSTGGGVAGQRTWSLLNRCY